MEIGGPLVINPMKIYEKRSCCFCHARKIKLIQLATNISIDIQ